MGVDMSALEQRHNAVCSRARQNEEHLAIYLVQIVSACVRGHNHNNITRRNMDDTTLTFEPDEAIVFEAEEPKAGRVTPLRAVRQECLDCCGGSANEVRLCVSKSCASWPFRLGKRPTAELRAEVADMVLHPQERGITGREFHENGGTALQAIKLKCLDCSGNIPSEVRDCKFTSCGLQPLRFGKNPNRSIRRMLRQRWLNVVGRHSLECDPCLETSRRIPIRAQAPERSYLSSHQGAAGAIWIAATRQRPKLYERSTGGVFSRRYAAKPHYMPPGYLRSCVKNELVYREIKTCR